MSRQGHVSNSYGLLIPKWRDLCMLRLLQGFLQAAPQAVFQLYVLCRKGTFEIEEDLVIAIAVVTSLISVVWSLVCYSKALRDLRGNAKDLPWVGFTCQVLWRLFMVVSRVVALVLFASHFQQWSLLAVLGHWLLMAMWLTCQRTQFCIDDNGREHPCKERIFNSVIAFIYVFCFFNTKEGMTRKRIVLFYSVILVENSLLISMWYPNRNLNSTWTYAALCVVWGGFVLGVFFMILYYKFYHHTHAFKGLFIRTKAFNLHGRKMYGLYLCCCFRVKKWDVSIYDCRADSITDPVLVSRDQNVQIDRPNAMNPYDGNLNWDNDDIQIRPLNGSCVRGDNPDQSALIQHPFVPDDDLVPDIVVTAASPVVISPQESVSKLSLEQETKPEEYHLGDEDDPPLSPGLTSLDKAREILASKLNKGIDSNSLEEAVEDEDAIPTINYGTVSFGNRYSLVSSDCLSISSDSSLSSFTNSLNDLLDRMGVAPKNEPIKKEVLKSSPADEGIYSDERESPAKPAGDAAESEPSSSYDAQTHNNMVNGHDITQKGSLQPEELFDELESMMDAPSSPYMRKRARDKDEGSESESTDASSDDRERRHSCEELELSFIHSTPNEEKTKRHSFDIADLSSNYTRAKKKGKNKRRFNKIIIFDNFVSSALKPGKYGSLRKSYERLSKIQEDTEESGLLSNDSLKENRNHRVRDDLSSLCNEEEIENIIPTLNIDDSETEHNSTINGDTNRDILCSPGGNMDIEPVKEVIERFLPMEDNSSVKAADCFDNSVRHGENETSQYQSENSEDYSLQDLSHIAESDGAQSSSCDPTDKDFIIEDLVPSKFSTVRLSHEQVPLACCEDFDDDLGSSMEGDLDILRENDNLVSSPSYKIDDEFSGLVSPPSDKHVSLQRQWSIDSIADSESCRESPNDTINRSIASSGSSIFENFLFVDQNSSREKKRHTFDFGAHRKARPEIVKRLGSSSSQHSLPLKTGSPIWVRKDAYMHRRRRHTVQNNLKNNNYDRQFIQEVRV